MFSKFKKDNLDGEIQMDLVLSFFVIRTTQKSPSVRFHSRINMTCVNNENGVVEPKKFGLVNWQREYTMEDILIQLKKGMATPHNRKLVQPP